MIKSFAWGATLIAVLAGAAQAADMPLKAPPVPVQIYNWTGFYVGFNAGYGWGPDRSVTFTPNDVLANVVTCGGALGGTCALPASSRLRGGFGGVQAGFNWQAQPNWLVGVEVDFDAADLKSTATNPTYNLGNLFTANFQAEQRLQWFATARARLGFLPTDRLLVYVTGGLAVARVEEQTLNLVAPTGVGGIGFVSGGFAFVCTGVTVPVCFSGNSSRTVTGWTAGGGLEWNVWQNTTFKAEYLYVNLRNADTVNVVALSTQGNGTPSSFTAAYGRPDFQLVRFGFNYRFGAPPVVANY